MKKNNIKIIKNMFYSKSILFIIPIIFTFFIPGIAISTIKFDFLNDPRPASPIEDRWVEANTATNPISFTVSDREGGPLYISCFSSNEKLVPNNSENIIIANKGNQYTVKAAPGERKKLTARIIPDENELGISKITFKVVDSGGLSASKSFDLTVVTADVIAELFENNSKINYVGLLNYNSYLWNNQDARLNILNQGKGRIEINGEKYSLPFISSFKYNDIIRSTAIPDEGWRFVYWSGDIVDTENPIDIEMDSSKIISARFVADKQEDNPVYKSWDAKLVIRVNGDSGQLQDEVRIGVDSNPLTEQEDENNEDGIIVLLSDIKNRPGFKTEIKEEISEKDYVWFLALKPLDNNQSINLTWDIPFTSDANLELWEGMGEFENLLVNDMQIINDLELKAKNIEQYFTIIYKNNVNE